MICPICSGNMIEKTVDTVGKDAEGNNEVETTEIVWFCRDCKRKVKIKQSNSAGSQRE